MTTRTSSSPLDPRHGSCQERWGTSPTEYNWILGELAGITDTPHHCLTVTKDDAFVGRAHCLPRISVKGIC